MCATLYILEEVEGELCLLEALEVPEVMRCVLLCLPEVVEGGLCSLELRQVLRSCAAQHPVHCQHPTSLGYLH